jgi:DNA repair exonuclease SbcCD nuclease subunit
MLNFSTDYHLGMSLNTHTTHESRGRLKTALYHQALGIVTDNSDSHYCLGDMVHTYRNSEETIQQVMTILSKLDNCIMGNHDVTNRSDSMGTMELLHPLYDIVPAVMGKCKPHHEYEGDAVLVLIPHTNSQELFEETLAGLKKKDTPDHRPNILLLHCNYESPWELNATTLNLTRETAKKLLEIYDYILIGHEHNYREDLDGRVILLGNTHPTNFGDISDKYRWSYTVDGGLEKTLVWEKEKHYEKVDPFAEEDIDSSRQFIEVEGDVEAAVFPAYCKWLAKLWKKCDKAYAIRSNVNIIREDFTSTIDEAELQSLEDTIAEELKDDEKLRGLFDEIRGEIAC